MKRLLAVAALVMTMCTPALALSDASYIKMKKNSPEFAQADKRLSRVWTNLKKSLNKKVFAELQKDQRQWVASGRDDAADAYMDEGYSRTEAYTQATKDRADFLPSLAEEIAERLDGGSTTNRRQTPARKPKPAPEPEPEPEPDPEPEPLPDPEPDPEPEQEDDNGEALSASDIEGEYKSKNSFMTVRILDHSSMEAEVTVSRWKDEVSWSSRGWIEDNVLELSDSQYSRCVATVKFSSGKARITISESEDWERATSEDFVLAGTYTKD